MEYHWYKEGEALLREIKNTNTSKDMLAIWYIGQMGMVAKTENLTICIDPVLNDLYYPDGSSRRNYKPPFDGNELKGIDYVLCTHNHADHMNLETLLPLFRANPHIIFIVPDPETERLIEAGIPKESVIGAKERKSIKLTEIIELFPIAAAHETYVTDEQGNHRNLGYVLDFNGIHLYHAGDTVVTEKLIADVKECGTIHIACIPINGVDTERHRRGIVGNMDCRDGAFFAEQIGADMVIPMHYDMVKKNGEEPLLFAHYMQNYYSGRKYHIMQLGERFLYMKAEDFIII